MAGDFNIVITLLEEYLKDPLGKRHDALEEAFAAFIVESWRAEIRRDRDLEGKVDFIREAIACVGPKASDRSIEAFIRQVEGGRFRNDLHVRRIAQIFKDHYPAYVRIYTSIIPVA